VYNVASGRARSIGEILDGLRRLSEAKNVAVTFDAARLRPADIPTLCGDPNRFRLTTGWEPAVPFEQTLHDTLMYWRARVRPS
jgi:nucleoside-diphosphate-sugar epimerase